MKVTDHSVSGAKSVDFIIPLELDNKLDPKPIFNRAIVIDAKTFHIMLNKWAMKDTV